VHVTCRFLQQPHLFGKNARTLMKSRAALLCPLLLAAAASATPAPTDCLFIHGTGYGKSGPSTSTDSDGYWGGQANIVANTPGCRTRSFIHLDTLHHHFDDAASAKAVCDFAADAEDNVVRGKRVFTHSFGNLVFASALRSGECKLDLQTSLWFSANAPWRGSKASMWVSKICRDKGLKDKVLEKIAAHLNYCDAAKHQVQLSYDSMRPDYDGLKGLTETAIANLAGAMCGVSTYGLGGADSWSLKALAEAVDYGEASDGMVSWSSCALQLGGDDDDVAYSMEPSPFYKTDTNHADGTCMNGDGKDANEQPCAWYRAMSLLGVDKDLDLGTPAAEARLRGRAKVSSVPPALAVA
jgi:hypothetical protein